MAPRSHTCTSVEKKIKFGCFGHLKICCAFDSICLVAKSDTFKVGFLSDSKCNIWSWLFIQLTPNVGTLRPKWLLAATFRVRCLNNRLQMLHLE